MLIAAVAMATMLGWAPDVGPAELVARLGSPRFAEREAAAESLKKLGRPALPALRRALSAADPEIRLRALKVRGEIEAAVLLEPTVVRLDFRDRPLSEVIAEFGRRAGVSVSSDLSPWIARWRHDRTTWPDRRVTLEAPGPLPFWEAVDRLCRAGGLRRSFTRYTFGPDEPFDQLFLVPGAASPPKSDVGPIRVELLGIRRERDLDLAPGALGLDRGPSVAGPPIRLHGPGYGPDVKERRISNFFVELLVSTEPRLRIVGEASLERLKATDDRAKSVLRRPTPQELEAQAAMVRMNAHLDPDRNPGLRFGSGSRRSASTQVRYISLDEATPPGGRLAELKGVAVVPVMGRRSDPIVVALRDVKDRTVEDDGVRLTVHEAVVKPSHFDGEVEFTLETGTPAGTFRVQGPGIDPVEIPRPIDLIEREIEVLDDQGRPMQWNVLKTPAQGVRGRMRLVIRSRNQGEPIDFSGMKLRVATMVGAAIEVPFAFADVPMP